MAPVPLVMRGGTWQAAGNVAVKTMRYRKADMFLWQLELTDLQGADRWFEVVMTGRPRLQGEMCYFAGTNNPPLGAEPYETPSWIQPLPLAAMWDENGGMALSLEPHEMVSYVHHTAAQEPDGPRFSLHIRLVVPAGTAKSISFVVYSLSGKWGFDEALERYYNLAPDIYDIPEGTDPRLLYGSPEYRAWNQRPFWDENSRRGYGLWEWCYAPFKRTGDIVGRHELWDYEPEGTIDDKMPFDSPEIFRQWRSERFADGERANIAMLFYVPAQVWCEEQLALERFADALTRDPRTRNHYTSWVNPWDATLRVLPWHTSFGEQSKRDVEELIGELDLSGFAFDTASGDARHNGPAAARFACRAWDEGLGEYVREANAIVPLMEYIRGFRNSRGHRVGVVANVGHPFYTIARQSDAAMYEASPWHNEIGAGFPVRWMMGRKPLVWWNGYALHELVQFEAMTAQQMAAAYNGMADFVVHESFRMAIIPPLSYTEGIESITAAMGSLTEFVHAGWEPVPSATVEQATFITRYGRGLATRWAVGNGTAETARPTVTVDNARLGGGSYVVGALDGKGLRNRLQGDTTEVRADSVRPRGVGLLRVRAHITPALRDVTAQADFAEDLDSAVLTITFSRPLPTDSLLSVPVPEGFTVTEIATDGRQMTAERASEADGVHVRIAAGTGRETIIRFTSTRYSLSHDDLAHFPFFADGAPAAAIVLRPNAGPQEELAAHRLVRYFEFYCAGAPDEPSRVVLPVHRGAGDVRGPRIVIDGGGGTFAQSLLPGAASGAARPQVGLAGDDLYITAPDGQSCHDAVWDLLFALDRHYVYPGPLWPMVNNVAVGIVGRWIARDGTVRGSEPLERETP